MIKIYTAKHCSPCHEAISLLRDNLIDGEAVRVIDIETDEGFEEFTKDVLSKGDGAVPLAYKDGQQCKIGIGEDDVLHLLCPQPSEPD